MILGTGNDLCDIRRIEAVLARHGARFTTRVFTDIEREKSDRRKARAASYAKRFAAKEACAKALGTGMAKGVSWRDIGVENAPGGRPSLVLTGRAKARLEAMTPFGHAAVLHLTLTDDFPMAQAFVIIEAVPIAPMSPADVAGRDAKGYSEFSQPGALMTEHTDTHTPPAPAPEAAKPRPKEGGIGETIRVVIEALLIALVIRTFAFQPFNIPSGSLIPTVLIGDYLFVSKYSYGYSKHSFPFSIVPLEGRVWAAEPKRGDIAVFKLPKDNETDYIKRVIGLPGDKVQVLDGRLRINGQPVQKEAAGTSDQADAFGRVTKVPLFKETLPGGVSYTVLEREGDRGYWDNTIEYTVPAGHFFMMGDNRDNSTDSRDLQSVGFVPYENFVGRAEVIFFSIDDQTPAWQVWKWPTAVRWERLFQKIR